MLYCKNIRIPGQFFSTSTHQQDTEADFLSRIRTHMQNLKCSETRNTKPFCDKNLQICKFVFLRSDHVRPPLSPPYECPYKVLKRDDKTMQLQINGKTSKVSVDRCKIAHILSEDILIRLSPRRIVLSRHHSYPRDVQSNLFN